MQRPGEAGGGPGRGIARQGVKRPDDVTAGRHCQTPARVQARPKGATRVNRWLKPLHCENGPNLADMAVRSDDAALNFGGALRVPVEISGRDGREEAVIASRRCCRGTAGRQPGQTVNGERGKRPRRARQAVACGRARCWPMRRGRGGAAVVVGAGESPVHGKGRQQDRSEMSHLGGPA
jgi:hypothetical protein